MATASLNNAANEKADNLLSTLETEILRVLRLLGSLKITCVMFALGVLILFVGTLAQDEATLPDVKRDYFNSWIAWVPFDVFVPITIWPKHSRLLGGFPMPGGALIGLTLLVNLVAAKMTRFKMTARGGRFFAGLGLTALGFGLIAMIVFGAHLEDGLQGEPWFKAKYGYDPIWYGCLTAVWAGFIGALAGAVLNPPKLWILRTQIGRAHV